MDFSQSFISQVTSFIRSRGLEELPNLTLIVPSHKLGNELLHNLGPHIPKAAWAPEIHTIPSFMQYLLPQHIPDELTLLKHLYTCLQDLNITDEPFELFLSWGKTLLRDFNTLDHYLIPHEQLFTTPNSQTNPPPFLSQFYDALKQSQNSVKEPWEKLWHKLPSLYKTFTSHLIQHQISYEGLHRKNLLHALKNKTITPPTNLPIITVGLYNLSSAEEEILTTLNHTTPLFCCWDYDPFYTTQNPEHPAGYFFRRRKDNPTFQQALKIPFSSNISADPPQITSVATNNTPTQLQALTNTLNDLVSSEGGPAIAQKSVIITPEDSLLLPLISAIPPSLGAPNILFKYPLTSTPTYQFLHALLNFQSTFQQAQGTLTTPLSSAIEAIIQHPYLNLTPEKKKEILKKTNQNLNTLHTASQIIDPESSYLTPLPPHTDIFEHLRHSLTHLQHTFKKNRIYPHSYAELSNTLELWDHLALHWPINTHENTPRKPSLHLLNYLQQAARKYNIPIGPPNTTDTPPEHQGITLMSLDQSIGLDFPYVFILSMNEGALPPATQPTSFIPQSLQKSLPFPSTQAYEANTAYPLFRLLQRAQKAFLFYTQGAQASHEPSRYLYALQYTFPQHTENHTFNYPTPLTPTTPLSIPKDTQTLQKLARYTLGHKNPKTLTPSAINTYLACPCCFYLQYVADIREPKKDTSILDANIFGSLFHDTMEQLYRPHLNTTLTKNTLSQTIKQIPQAIKSAYDNLQEEITHTSGIDTIATSILQTLATQVIEQDCISTPFTLLDVEKTYDARHHPLSLPINEDITVALGGIIDRIDKKDNTIKIIDYKTGTYTPNIPSIDTLFEKPNPDTHTPHQRNHIALQLLWYASLYHEKDLTDNTVSVMPSIISTRHPHLQPPFFLQDLNDTIFDIKPYIPLFLRKLRSLLQEIFDPNIPFTQTPQDLHSPYGLCHEVLF